MFKWLIFIPCRFSSWTRRFWRAGPLATRPTITLRSLNTVPRKDWTAVIAVRFQKHFSNHPKFGLKMCCYMRNRSSVHFRRDDHGGLGSWTDPLVCLAAHPLRMPHMSCQDPQFNDERYTSSNPKKKKTLYFTIYNWFPGHIANIIKRVINAKIPYVPWLTGYLAMAVGAAITFLVQSSSVFTSTLTPLVGVGVISLKRVYPLTLGSNIGTTTTALLASLAASPDKLHDTLQISLCHLFFNLTGILLFYPVPFTRLPIPMAKFLGNTTAKYRWFAIVYLVSMFFVLPGLILGISIGGTVALLCVGVPVLAVLVFIIVVKILQKKKPSVLPPVMRNWKWLPLGMRSLEPYDRLFARCACCKKCRPEDDDNGSSSSTVAIAIDAKWMS